MRRREIQNFTLKLNDLKEYEVAKQERLARASEESGSGGGAGSDTTSAATMNLDAMNTPEVSIIPLPKVMGGPKTKQEIRSRIGYPLELP
ncbi:uncharacterized protein LOC129762005 [Toxorhynchites rutilus septentrionalis]|uniref:uncharacterized protein LOC129762005 n=1 Tax=Toxorhynchites rutilus septentrionalis TaxID=329112 RepID=UPI00247ADD22|nr:uncharacterized protein LOC129762005 [Toxorhynchites rutilus septentrionalis]